VITAGIVASIWRRAVAEVNGLAVLAIARVVGRKISSIAAAEVWSAGVLEALGVVTASSVVDAALVDNLAALFAKVVAIRAIELNHSIAEIFLTVV